MDDFATINLKPGADPQFVLDQLGINADNGYGYRVLDGGGHALVVRTADLERAAALVADYDAAYLREVLIPSAIRFARAARKEMLTRMTLPNGMRLTLDETTLSRLTQAKVLIDEAFARGVALDEIDWEITEGQFITWPVHDVQDAAFFAGLHVQQTFSYQRRLYERIRNVPSAEALEAIDIRAGWPNQ